MTKVLVTGATGNTGPGLVQALRNEGVDVRAFVRNEEKAASLREAGAEIAVGDLDRPETIVPALEGVDKVYLLTWNGPTQLQQVRNVLAAVQEAGVNPHIVRHSMWGSERSRIVQQGNPAEEAVKASGNPWTVLKPTFFMQNTLLGAGTVAEDGVIYWAMDDAELAMIDVRDIIDAAVAVLTGTGHEGESYILTGPEPVSFHDVADALSEALDKDVNYVNVPSEALVATMVQMGFPEWIAQGYDELMAGFREGFAERASDDVRRLTGHEPRSIQQFANDFSGYFGGNGA